jgi:NTP pyrophosphatase (non-canonical NTP hydrolase)
MKRREKAIIADLGVAMQFKLMRHRNKGSWEHKSVDTLLVELKREVVELEDAVEAGNDTEHIISEAADVANYLAFLIEKVK